VAIVETCSASAPAKVIITGEHWVVHGSAALAAAVGLRSRVKCMEARGPGITIKSLRLGSFTFTLGQDSCRGPHCGFYYAASRIVEVCGEAKPATCIVDSDIPIGAGLGSSASVAVSFSAAYLALCRGGKDLSLSDVSNAASGFEKFVHGNPSGIDTAVVLHGGFIVYRRGEGIIMRINESLADTDAVVLIVDTGIARSTKEAVAAFTQNLSRLGSFSKILVNLAEQITWEVVGSLKARDTKRLGSLLYLSHGLLSALGVSHEKLEEIVQAARAEGALGAKLTGAGMGGTALVLAAREHSHRLEKIYESKGFKVYKATLGVPGLQINCDVSGRAAMVEGT